MKKVLQGWQSNAGCFGPFDDHVAPREINKVFERKHKRKQGYGDLSLAFTFHFTTPFTKLILSCWNSEMYKVALKLLCDGYS